MTSSAMPCSGRRRCGLLAGITLIDKGDLGAFARLRLNGLGHPADFGAVVGICGRDMESQKVSERIDGQMQLRTFLAFGSLVSSARPALGRRAQGRAVDDRGGRLLGALRRKAKDHPQILGQRLEAPSAQPSTRLLADDLPGRQVVGHPAPWGAGLHDIAQAIEDRAQGMDALTALFRKKRQVGRDKRPLLVGNVGRIRSAGPAPSRKPHNLSLISP